MILRTEGRAKIKRCLRSYIIQLHCIASHYIKVHSTTFHCTDITLLDFERDCVRWKQGLRDNDSMEHSFIRNLGLPGWSMGHQGQKVPNLKCLMISWGCNKNVHACLARFQDIFRIFPGAVLIVDWQWLSDSQSVTWREWAGGQGRREGREYGDWLYIIYTN